MTDAASIGQASESHTNACLAARAALEKQAEEVVVLDLRSLSTVTDFFVIGTAGSSRQLDALREHIEAAVARRGRRVGHVEGAGTMPEALQWLLMDFGDFVVHLFDPRARSFYRLEDLWADAPRVPEP